MAHTRFVPVRFRMYMRKWAAIAAQTAVSLVLLAVVFRGFEWGAFADAVRRLPIGLYLSALVIATAGQVLYAFKWHVAVRAVGVRVPFTELIGRYFIGIFFNNFLPSTVG